MKKKYGILGLGLTGNSVKNFFDDKRIDYHVWDRKYYQQEELEQTFKEFCNHSEKIVVSPGVSPYQEPYSLLQDNQIITDLDLFLQACPSKNTIAITGTNGKSTLVELLGHIIKLLDQDCITAGNNEKPVLDYLPKIAQNTYVILELSSFQLHRLKHLDFNVAALTTFSPDHLDWHLSLENYRNAKLKLFTNAQHQFCPQKLKHLLPRAHSWDMTYQEDSLKEHWWLLNKQLDRLPLHFVGTPLVGSLHQALQILMVLGFSADRIINAASSFSSLPHRFQTFMIGDIQWINDSKATNVDSTLAAFSALPPKKGPRYALLGGQAKNQSFERIAPFATEFDMFFLIGSCAHVLKETLGHKSIVIDTIDNFFKILPRYPKPQMVLLSPACASKDQFENYHQRGHIFIENAKKYCEEELGIFL